jgi:pimeloyl-ACP methyl ester carboxylesterase
MRPLRYVALLAAVLALAPLGAHAQLPRKAAPAAKGEAPPKPPPACSHCKEKLLTVDALRASVPADWKLALEKEPVFGGEVLVVQAGLANTQTLLLVHGLGQNGFTDWMTVLPQLAQRYHVLTLDLPGFGYSSSPAGKYSPTNYARVLDWLLGRYSKGPAIVVGHSMGGAVSLRLASDYPARVGKLVLADAAGILYRTAFVKHQATSNIPISVESVPGPLKDRVARMLDLSNAVVERALGLPVDPTRVLRASDIAWSFALKDKTNLNAALALVDEDFSAAVYTLQQPTHIIWGEADPIAPLRTGQALARRLPRAQLQTLPGVGHTPMDSATAGFLSLLNRALATEPAPAPSTEAVRSTIDLDCKGQVDRQYTGDYREIRITGCSAVTLTNVVAERIVIRDSIVQMLNVQIGGRGVALEVTNSEVVFTAGEISGDVAIRADAARLDLAGVKILAIGNAIEVERQSRLVASINEISSAAYSGYWHGSYELAAGVLVPTKP